MYTLAIYCTSALSQSMTIVSFPLLLIVSFDTLTFLGAVGGSPLASNEWREGPVTYLLVTGTLSEYMVRTYRERESECNVM